MRYRDWPNVRSGSRLSLHDSRRHGDCEKSFTLTAPPSASRLASVPHPAGVAATVALIGVAGAATSSADAQLRARVEGDLAALHATYVACRHDRASCQPSDVLIDAVASGDPGALRADLTALGMRDVAVAGRIVSGWLPVPAIPCLAGLATLQFARPALSTTQPGADSH